MIALSLNALELLTVECVYMISSSQVQQPSPQLHLARELDPSCWMMWPAMALRPDFGTALTLELVFTIVPILKTLVSDVKVCIGYKNGYSDI